MAEKSKRINVLKVKNKGAISRFFDRFKINRNYKDRLFVKIFNDKQSLLELYNAINDSDYKDADSLIITTIDNVLYMGMKNDSSFIVGSDLNLYEQQSTYCPNMPVRGLIYLVSIYQAYITEKKYNLYGRKLIKLPTPKYIVFYNGKAPREDIEEMRISEAFEGEDACLEFTAKVININQGHNQKLLEHCKKLNDYSKFIDILRINEKKYHSFKKAVDEACKYCISNDILREYLEKNRSEVTKVLLTEFDFKEHMKLERRDSKEEGIELGLSKGMEIGRNEGMEIGRNEGMEIMVIKLFLNNDITLVKSCEALNLTEQEFKLKVKEYEKSNH